METGTVAVRLPGIDREFRLDEWVHSPAGLYSSVNYGQNQSSTINAFSYIQGQTVPSGGSASTERDTNMPQAGFLPIGWEAMIFSHQVEPRTAMPLADYQDIWTKSIYVMKVGRHPVYEAPLSRLPGGGGLHLVTTANATSQVHNGSPSPSSKAAFLLPTHIREQKNFAVENRFPAALSLATANQLVWHFLEGLLKRPFDQA